MSLITDLADSLAVEINGHEFSVPLEAIRVAVPSRELKDLDDRTILVVPEAISWRPFTRDTFEAVITITLGIQRKITGEDTAFVAEMGNITDELVLFLKGRSIAGTQSIKIDNDPVYSMEHIYGQRCYTSLITVTYKKLV